MAMFSKKEKKQKKVKTPKEKNKNTKSFVTRIKNQFIRLSRFAGAKFEELFSKNKFSAIATLILAIGLVFSIHSLGNITLIKQVSDTIRNKEVTVEYDKEKYVIEGMPDTVDVILYGDDAAIQSTKTTNSLTVLADISEFGAGEHYASFAVENLPSNVTAYTNPSSAKVNIYAKEFKVFPISPELINVNAISGLTLENPVLAETQIQLKGAAKDLEKVSFVRALIDGKTINSTLTDKTATNFEGRAIVVPYDERGNKINNIMTDSGGIDYAISLEKAVGKPINDLKVNLVGNFPEGQAVKNIALQTETVTINGIESEIAKVSRLEVRFDLKNATASGTITGEVVTPTGVELTTITPQKITANIEFGPAETKKMEILSITKINNDDTKYDYTVVNDNTAISVDVVGTREQLALLEQITQTDPIKLTVDVGNLGEGEHQIALDIEGSSLFRYQLSQPTVKIRITEKQ